MLAERMLFSKTPGDNADLASIPDALKPFEIRAQRLTSFELTPMSQVLDLTPQMLASHPKCQHEAGGGVPGKKQAPLGLLGALRL